MKEIYVLSLLLCISVGIDNSRSYDRPRPPHPPPPPTPTDYYIYLQNLCPETIFFAASGPSEVQPVNAASWKADPGENITINPLSNWLHTEDQHHHRSLVGPRFWARTGCKYDESLGKAQCETGDCGNYYDCSAAKLAGRAPTTIAEFCFECGDSYTYYDISLVDGYSISVDIVPTGPHSATRPGDPTDQFWCKTNLCNSGSDLRTNCPADYLLTNKDLPTHNPSDEVYKIACFSNCGKFEYPVAPLAGCLDSDPTCKYWREYCCQATTYGTTCQNDGDCTDGGACWNGTCTCKAYMSNPPCSADICTNPSAQPPPGNCTDCAGDDTLHEICPRAYTWPNDPQTYSCDAKEYTIVFCPGGTKEPVTPEMSIPTCASLDSTIFDWATAQTDCSESHGKYLCAVSKPAIWACDVDTVSCDNVLCSWA